MDINTASGFIAVGGPVNGGGPSEAETTQQRLERLGLTTVARNLTELKERQRKLMLAYEHYRFIRPEQVSRFQTKLRDRTLNRQSYTYQMLAFTPLAAYLKVPPEDVLVKLEEAIRRNCFDQFEIAHIREVKIDPLLLGKIEGCQDLFYIAGWDTDVKIEDILQRHEG